MRVRISITVIQIICIYTIWVCTYIYTPVECKGKQIVSLLIIKNKIIHLHFFSPSKHITNVQFNYCRFDFCANCDSSNRKLSIWMSQSEIFQNSLTQTTGQKWFYNPELWHFRYYSKAEIISEHSDPKYIYHLL